MQIKSLNNKIIARLNLSQKYKKTNNSKYNYTNKIIKFT